MIFPAAIAFAGGMAHIYFFDIKGIFLSIVIFFSLFLMTSLLMEFYKGIIFYSERYSIVAAFFKLFAFYGHRYGGYVIHIGTLFAVMGICGSLGSWVSGDIVMEVGEEKEIQGYTITYKGITAEMPYPDVSLNLSAMLAVSDKKGSIAEIRPRREIFNDRDVYSRVSVHKGLKENIAVLWKDFKEDRASIFRFKVTPLASWIRIGWWVVLPGVLIILFKKTSNRLM